jgi:hypothetical protein
MADPLDSVNEYARLNEKWAEERRSENPKTADVFQERAKALRAVADELAELRRWKMPVPASYGDISDLPTELIAQLSGVKTDELEDQIYAIVKAAGAEIELDRLLIELFRRHGEVHERRFLNNKAYRMVQKGLIHQVSGRKGVYTITPQDTMAAEVEFGEAEAPARSGRFRPELDDEIPF